MKLYDEFKKQGIDPFKKFIGDRYNILIPLNDLDRFSYTPSYEKDYKELGLMDLTYAVNPDMYVAMLILNKLATIFDVKFRVMEAWRPFEIQVMKYNEHQKKNPGSTLFLKPDKDKTLPHCCSGAIDLLMTDSYGNPFTQPKWLLRKDPSLLKQIKKLNKDFDNVDNPFFTTHIEALDNASIDLKLAILNVDILRKMVSSITNLGHINDENWHFQLEDKDPKYLVSYKNISIFDVKTTSQGHIDSVKKEMTDFANQIFGVFYNRPFTKGKKELFQDSDFTEKDIITLQDLKNDIYEKMSLQQKILYQQKMLTR